MMSRVGLGMTLTQTGLYLLSHSNLIPGFLCCAVGGFLLGTAGAAMLFRIPLR